MVHPLHRIGHLRSTDPGRSLTHMATRVGFFGPFGTFTQQALLSQPDLLEAEHVAYRTVPDVLDAVESGDRKSVV